MKRLLISHSARRLAAVWSGLAILNRVLEAAPFLYSPGDLLLSFRQPGNASDYVVNIGKATSYNALPASTTVAVANLSAAQLGLAFPSINGLKWAIAGANRPPLITQFPEQTLWIAAPRQDPEVQGPAWLRKGGFTQGATGSQVDAIGLAAAASSSSQSAGAGNSAVGVIIPVSTDYTIGPLIGEAGDYLGSFQGNVENLTADDFDADAANVSRSDLYELLPGTVAEGTRDTPGRWLGYFELKPDGTLTFNTSKPLPPRPTIADIQRAGDVTTVTFATATGVTYRLRATDVAGLAQPVRTWSIGASLTGDGSVRSLQSTDSAEVLFFAVEALP